MTAGAESEPREAATAATGIAVAGLVSLAVAMGIGRFAFTPLLPLMLRDGVVDIAAASWLASANYLGYLGGALFCTFQPWLAARIRWLPAGADAPRWVRAGLVATVALTLGMALPWPAAWPMLRFAAGVASAFTLVYTTSWCFTRLAAHGRSAIGGLVFVGPGAGIVASGVAASGIVAAHGSAAIGWALFALLAAVLTAAVWRIFDGFGEAPAVSVGAGAIAAPTPISSASGHGRVEMATLTLAYGLAGFGYIVTATFLPVIARVALPGSPWIELFWPVFGIGAMVGAMFATRAGALTDRRLLLAGAYAVQAVGVLVGLVWPTLAGFAAGSFLIGLPFTTITFFALQEVRRLRARNAASAIGLATAVYGIGQVIGPPMVSLLVARSASAANGFDASLEIAAGVLLAGTAIFIAMTRIWPARRAPVRR